jgi:hypothetical protein
MHDPKTLPLAVMELDDGAHALVVPATGEEAVIASMFGALAVDVVWSVRLSSH